jgi:putative FmdB family regulatory protein
MPIYAYRCESCGFEKDVLQKMSDAPLSHCPECSKETFRKQVTAAGFQLKGSGWYVTDFRSGSSGAKNSAQASDEPVTADKGKPEAASSDNAASPASAPASAPSESSNSSGTGAAASPPAASSNSNV